MAGFREARARRHVHGRVRRVRRRRVRDVVRCGRLLHRAQSRASTGSRRRRPSWVMHCGPPSVIVSGPREPHDRVPSSREAEVIGRIDAFRRRRPRLKDEIITLAHGAGGKSSAALVDAVFLRGVRQRARRRRRAHRSRRRRLAMSTDSFVVQPLRFPGGSIGHLAVHGTVNDLAMAGAVPRWLSAAFVLEEGFPIAELRDDRRRHGRRAAAAAGVAIVTGDTKVVGHGRRRRPVRHDGGRRHHPEGRALVARRSARRPVLLSGTMGDHGMAVMLARGDLAIDADIASDTAAVSGMVEHCSTAAPSPGGCATPPAAASARSPTSSPRTTGLAVVLDEPSLPVARMVARRLRDARHRPALRGQRGQAASPSSPPDEAAAGLAALRAHPLGRRRRRHRGDRRRARTPWSCCAPRSAAPGSWTCSSATHCPRIC